MRTHEPASRPCISIAVMRPRRPAKVGTGSRTAWMSERTMMAVPALVPSFWVGTAGVEKSLYPMRLAWSVAPRRDPSKR
eukprot:6487002-Amphidinium_carterae.1